VAVVVAAIVAIWILSFTTQPVAVDAAMLPASPRWVSEVPAPAAVKVAATAPAVHEANDGSFAIQVASLTSRARADRLVAELAEAGLGARTVEFDLGAPRGIVLQIRVDGYKTAADADRDLKRIRELPGYSDAHLLSN
jgi:cell division septation protein DedD